MGTTQSAFEFIVLGLVFILWVALSFGIYDYITTWVSADWWMSIIALCILWLVFVVIVYVVDDNQRYRGLEM